MKQKSEKKIEIEATTYTDNKQTEVSFDSILKAKELLNKSINSDMRYGVNRITERIELCKKHWKELENILEVREFTGIGSLYGVRVIVRPYLKKIHLYYNYKGRIYEEKP